MFEGKAAIEGLLEVYAHTRILPHTFNAIFFGLLLRWEMSKNIANLIKDRLKLHIPIFFFSFLLFGWHA